MQTQELNWKLNWKFVAGRVALVVVRFVLVEGLLASSADEALSPVPSNPDPGMSIPGPIYILAYIVVYISFILLLHLFCFVASFLENCFVEFPDIVFNAFYFAFPVFRICFVSSSAEAFGATHIYRVKLYVCKVPEICVGTFIGFGACAAQPRI